MAPDVVVRRARLSDVGAIATFVNAARLGSTATRRSELSQLDVAQRFGQVGFMIAERDGRLVGLLGWQVENLVVRVIDFLIASAGNSDSDAYAMTTKMEAEGAELQAESVLLFLPEHPSPGLVVFWERLGYEFQSFDKLPRAWQEAVVEQGRADQRVMVKRLKENSANRPL